MATRKQSVLPEDAAGFYRSLHGTQPSEVPVNGPAAPTVWVVASHRELTNPQGKKQCYTVMDEAGTRTLVNMGLQPVCYPRVPDDRIESMLATVDGLLLGGSDTNVDPALYGEEPIDPELMLDHER